jgi:2-polyprenyl-3-methyl-5-hydroxy-6-metoxy-1,4-benzoquinol methylase
MPTTDFDGAKAEAFAGRLMGYANGAFAGFCVSVGHRTGLFDKMAGMAPSTSQQIADAAGLNERYVRECLGGLVTSGIVEYDKTSKTYVLPPEHAAFMTSAARNNNIAAYFQSISVIGEVEDQIVDCFQNGGGVPYTAYSRFHPLMASLSAPVFDVTLVDVVLPLVPGAVDRLKAGADVVDLGCGSGHAINVMAKAFPNSRFTGWDFSEQAVAAGRAEARELGLSNASFEVQDVPKAAGEARFDLITTFDAIHDQADPAGFLSTAYRLTRPGGVYMASDIAASSDVGDNVGHPMGPFLYGMSMMHCMTVSLAYDGVGLGAVWGEQKAVEMLKAAGFADVQVKQAEGDILNNYYICQKT